MNKAGTEVVENVQRTTDNDVQTMAALADQGKDLRFHSRWQIHLIFSKVPSEYRRWNTGHCQVKRGHKSFEKMKSVQSRKM